MGVHLPTRGTDRLTRGGLFPFRGSGPRPGPAALLLPALGLVLLGVGGCVPTNRIAVNAQGQLVLALDAQGRYDLLPQEGADLYLWNPESGELRRLTPKAGFVGLPQWSPDGGRLLYVTWGGEEASTLWLFDPRTQEATPLLQRRGLLWNPQFSPDGRQIAFRLPAEGTQTPSFELEIVDASSGESRYRREGFVVAHRWRPDGSLVVWTARALTRSDGHLQSLLAEVALLYPERPWSPEISLLQVLIPEGWADWYPYWEWLLWDLSPDGQTLLLTLAETPIAFPQEAETPMALYSAEIRGERVERVVKLAERAGYPAFSPSGQKIAYVTGAEGEVNLRVLDRTTGLTRQVTPRPGNYLYPFWVDEEHLGFLEQEGNTLTIWVADLATGSLANLTELLWEHFPKDP